MTTHKQSRAREDDSDQRLEQLLIAMGMNEDPFLRYALVGDLELIEQRWSRWRDAPGDLRGAGRLGGHRALIAQLLSDCEEIGHDFLLHEIEQLGFARLNPHADEATFPNAMADIGCREPGVVGALKDHLRNVDHWLEINGTTYRQRIIRKQVVEPFLRLMVRYDVETSRKQRPRKKVFDALFDLLEVGPPRPTSANINKIAKELKTIDSPTVKSKTAAK